MRSRKLALVDAERKGAITSRKLMEVEVDSLFRQIYTKDMIGYHDHGIFVDSRS